MTSLEEAYTELSKVSDFNVGDTVKVLRKAKDYELGWANVWESDMDDFVGKTFVVKRLAHDAGVCLTANGYYFPFFVLEKVKQSVPKSMKILCKAGIVTLRYDKDVEVDFSSCGTGNMSDLELVTKTAKKFRKAHQDNK